MDVVSEFDADEDDDDDDDDVAEAGCRCELTAERLGKAFIWRLARCNGPRR